MTQFPNIGIHVEQLIKSLIDGANSSDNPDDERSCLTQLRASIVVINAMAKDGCKFDVSSVLGSLGLRNDIELKQYIDGYFKNQISISGDASKRELFLAWIENCKLRHWVSDPENGGDNFRNQFEALQKNSRQKLVLF